MNGLACGWNCQNNGQNEAVSFSPILMLRLPVVLLMDGYPRGTL